MSDDKPTGLRFSQAYLDRGTIAKDSPRFRRRLEKLFTVLNKPLKIDFGNAIEAETGCKVPWDGFGHSFERFFEHNELRDVLDAITIIGAGFRSLQLREQIKAWSEGVSRIFQEENVGYRLDEKGGVHFLVDQEFERNRVASLVALGGARYTAARNDFEQAQSALDQDPVDTRGAIRYVFDALETVFKLTFDSASRLDAGTIDKKLTPAVLPLYEGAARDNVARMLVSFREWTNGAHQYRHAQGVEQPAPPPMDLAVMIVSAGAAWLRWLIEIDSRLGASPTT